MKRLAWLGAALLAVGCGTSSVDVAKTGDESATVVTVAKFNEAGAPTVDFSVPEMHCESCVAHVEGILSAQPGVKDVEVDLGSLTAKVAVDDNEFDGKKAVAALVDMRFDKAEMITAEAAAAAKAKAKEQEAASADEAPATPAEEAVKS